MDLEECEVFLSFRGIDTRKSFTNVLYNYLRDVRVRTFIDSENLHVGETIAFELLDRIQKSKISIAIFSKGYASSRWCLDELVEMVQMARCEECRKRETPKLISKCKNCNKRNCGHKIIPIFYDVTPDDVKLKTKVYGQFFDDHNNNYKYETVQQWRDVLKGVGGLKGLELAKETNGYEGDLARSIVNKVMQKLKKSEVQLPEILVGMEHHKEKLKGFLNPDNRHIQILGICGMGGIGKTIIAKVIYNQLCKHYGLCCFLENFETKSSTDPNYLVQLHRELVSNFSRGGYSEICNVEKGREYVKLLIEKQKFLLVLDDVDKESQFKDFFGNCNLVDSESGSTIIVTTRNKEVLNWLERNKGDNVFEIYEPPLLDTKQSLTLFSKFAFSSESPPNDFAIISDKIVSIASGLPLALEHAARVLCGNEGECNAILRKLKKFPHGSVLENLSRSIKTLDDQQRDIFLDTACLFKGHDSNITSYMWEDCGLDPKLNVEVNVKRSLMKNDANSLWMHRQLKYVGREIVRKEDIHDAGKRSRLWSHEEALDVFDRRMGTNKVLAICLSFMMEELESRSDSISREDFDGLQNLRFLIAGSIDFKGDFQRLFSNLRWLQWKPLGIISPTNCELKNLVILDLSESQIMDNWNGWIQIKRSTKLKVLNLSKCDNLSTAPDFSTFQLLERLILASCRRLGNIELCTINPQNLRLLNLSDCTFLRQITFDFSLLWNLEYLDVHSCTQLTSLQGLNSLLKLEYLDTSGCPKLETLPDLSHFQKLKILRIAECKKLTQILGLNMLISLEHLDIRACVNVRNVPNISNMTLLKEVLLSRCIVNVEEVKGIWKLESLETLDMSWCTSVERMEEQILNLSRLKKLKNLNLAGFGNFNQIQGLEELEYLEQLNISWWRTIQNLPDLSNLKKLKEIKVHMCRNLSEIRSVERLESLKLLVITGTSLQTLPDLPNTTIERKF